MTYVTDMNSEELRAHINMLQKLPGWHEPFADRLIKEIRDLDEKIVNFERQVYEKSLICGEVINLLKWLENCSDLEMSDGDMAREVIKQVLPTLLKLQT